jgi:hypothetical protein
MLRAFFKHWFNEGKLFHVFDSVIKRRAKKGKERKGKKERGRRSGEKEES